ncbi:N-acetylmuramoyl-L-alanine amidase [Neisseria leonii]|uniref:N-acetylmuramoyl-L-alanine amidase AmiC n=1 Tax=Neisseria leonii TaxID=2995413 RepID=A0A9X4E263_9NEIS|nr:N-acetylmuramoyl-L-alanine amidase [Neisseria sp. 51.81]MDD9327809.1 N-acetylmuramoyl-L-alanine amidase [Neisseria sp. 51.81]
MDSKLTRRRFLSCGAAAGLLFTLAPALARAAPRFVAVRIWPASAYTRITLEASEALQYNYFSLDNPRRLVIDIKNARLDTVLQSIGGKVQSSDPYIGNIRVGQNTPDTVRVVVDLKTAVNPQLFALNPIANFRHRLVIDLYPAHAAETDDPLMALLADYSKGRINTDGTGAATPPVQTPLPEAPPARSGTRRRPVVILDPGHGGEDPGAMSKNGLREKDVVLSIARETKKLMEARGYTVHMTRNEDVFIPLGVRVAKARQLRGDLFISIHADAFTNPDARGSGVYVLNTHGATSAAARFLAQTQNAADLIGGVKSMGNRSVDSAILDMTQTVTNRDSKTLGQHVLTELGKYNRLHKGRIDEANFAVLRAPDIPSILVETAFISNPVEEQKLAGTAFRRECARAIADGTQKYLATAVLARR